jgi:glucose-6-phosphate 1-dehydrogenase
MTRPENHVIVIFGATGDLAKRKLLPGVFHLAAAGLMPEKYRIIGSSPASSAMTDVEFRQHAKDAVEQFGSTKPTGPAWDAFEANLFFGAADPGAMGPLNATVHAAEDAIGGEPRRLFHLAVPPVAFTSVINELGSSGLATPQSRVIIEKPFGEDLASGRALNADVHKVFSEDQIFRIDHFLGKESVDNILAFRFGNGLFEPIWNRNYLRYVQIDVPETLTIEGRASFYDATGAYRDMVVTHLFQVLGFVAMEPPTSLDSKPLRDEKTKVFDAVKPIDVRHVVRGQYEGYLSEPGVPANSDTETMVAVRAQIDNWRWHGVPFYLRSGKAMAESRQVVTIGFREPVLRMFHLLQGKTPTSRANEIVIDFADPGSITIDFLAKEPGAEITLEPASMTFSYANSFNEQNALEGYERLILDAMLGIQSLFTNSDGIERVWEVSEPLLQSPPPVKPYAKGSWGPPEVNELIAPHHWHLS